MREKQVGEPHEQLTALTLGRRIIDLGVQEQIREGQSIRADHCAEQVRLGDEVVQYSTAGETNLRTDLLERRHAIPTATER